MARELGLRPDALRIIFGIPTRLQRLVRGTTTFEEVAALAGEFQQEDRSRSCGPKFEEAEKGEYLARRAELFPVYLAQFTTIESFLEFGVGPAGDGITFQKENSQASEKLCDLLRAEIKKAEARKKIKIEALVKVYALAKKFMKDERSEKPRASAWAVVEELQRRIRWALETELEDAKAANNASAAVAVFRKLGPGISIHDLRKDDREREDQVPWRWLWTDVGSLEEILFIEREVQGGFLARDAVEGRIVHFVGVAIEKTASFREARAFAQEFVSRDKYQPSEIYSRALEAAVEKVRTVVELRRLIAIWQRRGRSSDRSSSFRQPDLPRVFVDKWDTFFLPRAETESNLKRLAKLMERSLWNSGTRRVARERLEAHFEAKMAEATSPEAIDRIEEEAKTLSRNLNLPTYRFKGELRDKQHAKRVQALWAMVERGDPIDDEKRVLIGLYHEFKEKDPERAHKVLLRLAKHFPAEAVDEVPTEV